MRKVLLHCTAHDQYCAMIDWNVMYDLLVVLSRIRKVRCCPSEMLTIGEFSAQFDISVQITLL